MALSRGHQWKWRVPVLVATLVYVFTGLCCGITHALVVGVHAGAVARNTVMGAQQDGMFLTAQPLLGSPRCLIAVTRKGRTRPRAVFSPRSSCSKVGGRVKYGRVEGASALRPDVRIQILVCCTTVVQPVLVLSIVEQQTVLLQYDSITTTDSIIVLIVHASLFEARRVHHAVVSIVSRLRAHNTVASYRDRCCESTVDFTRCCKHGYNMQSGTYGTANRWSFGADRLMKRPLS